MHRHRIIQSLYGCRWELYNVYVGQNERKWFNGLGIQDGGLGRRIGGLVILMLAIAVRKMRLPERPVSQSEPKNSACRKSCSTLCT